MRWPSSSACSPLPVNNSDGTILQGEFIPDTWGSGLDRLPYPASVREAFKKFKKEILAIDLEKRAQEFYNMRFSDFLKGYPEELKQWWDAYGASNYGARCDDAATGVAVLELQSMAAESTQDDRYTWPGGLGAMTRKLSEILRPQLAEQMISGATTVGVVPEKSGMQVTYLRGIRTEDGLRQSRHHGDPEVHHPPHRRGHTRQTKPGDASDPLRPVSGGEPDFRQTRRPPGL